MKNGCKDTIFNKRNTEFPSFFFHFFDTMQNTFALQSNEKFESTIHKVLFDHILYSD